MTRPSIRRVRLRWVWILILPFLFFAHPTPTSLLWGLALATAGGLVRAWAAGTIVKDERLAIGGPYAFTRNPLYVGSFLIGLGVTVAGVELLFIGLFVVFFLVVYGKAARVEARFLAEKFGDTYGHYAACVPLFRPRLTPYRPPAWTDRGTADTRRTEGVDASSVRAEREPPSGFSFERYMRNKEWEAGLGIVFAFLVLAGKMIFFP